MIKRLVMGTAAAVVLIGISACGAQDPAGGYSDDPGEESLIPSNSNYVKQIDVDGTTCIIFRDAGVGGISCDWSNDEELD